MTRKEFRREKLTELARADAWRYLERIAIPLALKSQPGTLAIKDEGQMELPFVFMDVPQLAGDEAREREAGMLGGGVFIEGEMVRNETEPDGVGEVAR